MAAERALVVDMRRAESERRLVGLLRLMTDYHWHYIAAIASIMVAALARVGILLLIAYFVDDILFMDNVEQVIPFIALGFLGLAVVEGGMSYLAGRLSGKTAEQVAWRLRNYLFDHMQRLSFSYHDRMQTGELLQRATSDVETIRRFYIEQGVGLGRVLLLFTVNFIAIAFIRLELALISIVTIPILVSVSIYFFRKISDIYDDFQAKEGILSTALQENLSGVRVVKAFARQDYERDKFEKTNWAKYQSGRQLIIMEGRYWPFTDLVLGFQFVASLFIGATLALNGDITLGQYLAFVGMLGWMINPMRQIGRLIVQVSTALVSYDRVMEIIKQEKEPLRENEAAPVQELRGEIEFKNVNFGYDEEMPVLHNISFRAEPGQTIALLGSTGSGKTSLLALLPRFYDYTSGSITLDGLELREYPRAFLREHIGVVEQEPFLFSRSIRENITYGVSREVSDEEVFTAAQAAAIHDVILSFPEGYQTLVGERGVTLSGGQKQRVALARTLLKNPKILILDDATSSVDTETEAAIRSALGNMMKERTSFVIAHRIHSVMTADLILVMDKGRIVQMGTHDELMLEDGIYRRTYDMQSRIEEELEKELASV
ncbi:MAG: ABC transporter ATP-binding protein [Anaerolineae bacterium]